MSHETVGCPSAGLRGSAASCEIELVTVADGVTAETPLGVWPAEAVDHRYGLDSATLKASQIDLFDA